jgi:hypothetical protein
MTIPTRAVLVGTPTLMMAAGLLLIAAARERWAATCPFGSSYETGACLSRQDHAYDFLAPVEPWLPVGNAAALAGAALLVLAVAAAGVPALMLGPGRAKSEGWQQTALVVVCAAVPFVGLAVIGWGTLLSGLQERALTVWPAPAYGFAWAIGWPLVLIALAGIAVARELRGNGWRWLTVLLLVGSTPLGMVVAGPAIVGYASYDTAPWTEAAAGILLLLAAPALWRAGVVGARPGQPVGSSERSGRPATDVGGPLPPRLPMR